MLTTRRALLAAGLLAILASSLVASAALLQVESATLATFSLTVELPSPPPVPGCTRSHGFWKNHADQWPVDNLLLGLENYPQEELVVILGAPAVGDASLILARQQIAAKLNLAAGADGSEIASTIGGADSWLAGFSGKLPYGVSPSSEQGQEAVALADVLEQYNDGVIGPGSCDEDDGDEDNGDDDDGEDDDGEEDDGEIGEDTNSSDPEDAEDPNPDPVEPPSPDNDEGCEADYWRNEENLEGWPDDLSPEAQFSEVFEVESPESLTLLEALALEGNGVEALIREATAALLNALSPDIEFGKSAEEIIELFQAAFGSDDPELVAETTQQLEELNGGDCPWPSDGEPEDLTQSDIEQLAPTATETPGQPTPTESPEPTPTPEE